jgi:hypothetical protein
MFWTKLLIPLIFIPHWSFAEGQVKCENDTAEIKGSSNYAINSALFAARDPLSLAFKQYQKRMTVQRAHCAPDETPVIPLNQNRKDLGDVASACMPAPPRIKAECIKGGLNRNTGGEGYSCVNGKPVKFSNVGESSTCLNRTAVDYITYSVNLAIECMSTPEEPIDPRVVLKKLNSESGFNYFLAQAGGKGIGQLIEDPVMDMAGWWDKDEDTGKVKWHEGNGKPILRAVVDSTNPACAPFKQVIEDELDQSPPPLPGSKANYCTWIGTGDGLARNLVYSLGYYMLARDRYIEPTLRARAPQLANNPAVLNYFTLVAYGPKGQAESKALMDTLNIGKKSKPADVMKQIIKHSDYVEKYESRVIELHNKLEPGKVLDEADLSGDSCLEK